MDFIKPLIILCVLTTMPWYSYSNNSYTKCAMHNMQKGNWDSSIRCAQSSGKPEIMKVVLAQKYLSSLEDNSFENIIDFLQKNPFWPQYRELAIRAEEMLRPSSDYKKILSWFKEHPPQTQQGYKYYGIAAGGKLQKAAKQPRVEQIIKAGWVYGNFNNEEQEKYLKAYNAIVSHDDHVKKINFLLWKNDISCAEKLLKLVSNNYRRVFEVRIAIAKKHKNIDRLYKSLPVRLKNDSGLLFAYLKYKKQNAEDISAIKPILVRIPQDKDYQELWWPIKAYYIRELIDLKDYKLAYKIAQTHAYAYKSNKIAIMLNQSSSSHESAWIAGWIALSFLNNPKAATKHFKAFYNNVSYPISLARGAYWIARSYEIRSESEKKMFWLKKAAAFPETFYGQLALTRLGQLHVQVPRRNAYKETTKFYNAEVAASIKLLIQHKNYDLAWTYLQYAISHAKDIGDIAFLVKLAASSSYPHLTLKAAKAAAYKKVLIADYKYPRPYKIFSKTLEKPLVYSIIKQESVFDEKAISYAHAYGLMQLVEPTAKEVSRSLGLRFLKRRLISDPHYNIRLGSRYIENLINDFQGSYVLALAAYNAGPSNVAKWISKNNDPRNMEDLHDIVQWIELIPFSQTRNYIQRVLENLQVYRVIMDPKAKLRLIHDLKRGYKASGNNI